MSKPAQPLGSYLIMLLRFIKWSISSLVLILHVPSFSFVGPYILLKMFLSKIINFLIIAYLSTHVSEAYITVGLINLKPIETEILYKRE